MNYFIGFRMSLQNFLINFKAIFKMYNALTDNTSVFSDQNYIRFHFELKLKDSSKMKHYPKSFSDTNKIKMTLKEK